MSMSAMDASARRSWRGQRPWHVRKLLERKPGGLTTVQAKNGLGPRRGGEEPKLTTRTELPV